MTSEIPTPEDRPTYVCECGAAVPAMASGCAACGRTRPHFGQYFGAYEDALADIKTATNQTEVLAVLGGLALSGWASEAVVAALDLARQIAPSSMLDRVRDEFVTSEPDPLPRP